MNYRLPSEYIDRSTKLRFEFNGRTYYGYKGDTLASALLGNGVSVVARSFKYHRPRGIVAAGPEEPNAIVQIGTGALSTPDLNATQVELYDGMRARCINAWPSLNFDLLGINNVLGKLLSAGFYYKTFMWPRRFWPLYEHLIRHSAGLGKCPSAPDPEHYERRYLHCDLLIVGGGPAGLAAALTAGRAGARVILMDEKSALGGQLLGSHQVIDDAPAARWVDVTREQLGKFRDVTILTRTTGFGYYDDNYVCALERASELNEIADEFRIKERLLQVRARQVILATGALERPLIFSNNDRPGIMLASAVSTYVNRFGIVPGRRVLVFTNNDSAYQTALDLVENDITVAAVVDSRRSGGGHLAERVTDAGVEVIKGHVVRDVEGIKRVKSAICQGFDEMARSVGGSPRIIGADVIAVSGGWNPAVHLHSQAGGRIKWRDELACFVPESSRQANISAGSCNGAFDLHECIEQGINAASEAMRQCGYSVDSPQIPETGHEGSNGISALWRVPGELPVEQCPKQFVDFQNDATVADLKLAVDEGYDSIEHVKRYTAMGFGTDQGKLGNINGAAIIAEFLDTNIGAIGTTTFRPPYTPVTFGACAAETRGSLFDPVRKTPVHDWHEKAGAEFEVVGQWLRPWYYPRDGENMDQAVQREALAVRNAVGVMDASTLGKIDVRGPDAARFLDRIYTNDWLELPVGRCRYGMMLGENGMVMDDGVSARLGNNHFHMTTTTGGAAAVLSWMEKWLQTEWPQLEIYLTSVTERWSVFAVSGPDSRDVIAKLCDDVDCSDAAFPFMSVRTAHICGVPVYVFRISFSGERAYEINVPSNYGLWVWEKVIEAGYEYGITPYGTEAMHLLRAEKGFVIVGQDTDGSVTPLDLGMEWICSKKKDFIGKRSLSRADCVRAGRPQLVGLLSKDGKSVLAEGAQLVEDPNAEKPIPLVGHVTSSYFSPGLGHPIALALVNSGLARMGSSLYAIQEGSPPRAVNITKPVFYDPEGSRQYA